MDSKEKVQEIKTEYEPRHNALIASEHMKPGRVIIPAIVIVMIIAVMCIYTLIQKKNIVANAEQVTNQMAEYIAGNIANEMDYAESSIRFVSDSISHTMTSDTIEDPAAVITPLVENSPFDDIEYIRADGMNVMNIGEPFDASDRVYYIEGMKGNTGVWNNYHPKTSKETLMNFYTPIIYQGKISGVLTGYIAATTQIAPLFETKLYGQDIYGLLVDENDMVICSTIKSEYVKDLTLDLFMEQIGITKSQGQTVYDTIKSAGQSAVTYKDPEGEARVSVVKIPSTEWKVAILVPDTSVKAIVGMNTRDSVITIIIIALILIIYASAFLWHNVKRRREIAKENEKLEEENRIYDEENKRAFMEISAIRDIIASANMGTWRIEIVDGKKSCMYVDDTMKGLLGVLGRERTPEETYSDWYDNITPEALPSVLRSVEKMKMGSFDENTYLWRHPQKGERYVRCGGTARKIEGGFLLSGYHYDVDEAVREDLARVAMLQEALNEKNDYYNTLGTLAGIYNSMHIIDLVEDKIVEFSTKGKYRDLVDNKKGAGEKIAQVINSVATDECREAALEFTDLNTLADRMQNRKYISAQLISKRIGWFLAGFIALDTDADGRPVRVVLTTQSIDEEKRQEEKLIRRSKTDELTGLFNRRAYEEDIYENNDILAKDDFVLMSIDVNGLKVVNDTKGHAAGDELLIGAGDCMKKSLGPYGKIYRTGGDEFIAILFCDKRKLKEVLATFEETMENWKGKHIEGLTVSYGYVSREEEPEKSVRQLGIIADKRMYEAKSAHYRKTGVDRRGNEDAHRALCGLYNKILKINLSDDSYRIISMDMTEQTEEKGFSDKISSWLSSFASSGQVHPEDRKLYLEKTDISYLRAYFAGNKEYLCISYRRKAGEGYKDAMMEIIPASDYSQTEEKFYLYVKYTER